MEQYYDPELLRFAFILGLVVSLAFYERSHLTTGGIAVPGYMALAIFQPLIIPAVVCSALMAHTIVRRLVAPRVLLSDRAVFSLTVVVSAGIHAGLDWSLVAAELIAPSSPLMRGIGYIVPGLIAHDIDRHGFRNTMINTGAASAVVACALIAIVVSDPSLARLTTSPVQDVFSISLERLPVLILVGVVAWLGVVRRHRLRCGGVVGGAYIALLALQPWELLRIFLIALATMVIVRALSRHAILFGRRLFGAHMAIGALLAWATFRVSELYFSGDTIATVTPSLSIVGMLVAGLLCHDIARVGVLRTATGVVAAGGISLVCALLLVEWTTAARSEILIPLSVASIVAFALIAVPHRTYKSLAAQFRRTPA